MSEEENAKYNPVIIEGVNDQNTTTEKEYPNSYTFEEGLDAVGFGYYQYTLLQICGLGWLLDGVQLSMIPFILPQMEENWKLTPLQNGAIGAVVFIGMMFGALIGGFISDRYGRKIIFVGGILVTSIGSIGTVISPEYYSFLVMRLLVGFGLGGTVPTDFSMFMEYIPSSQRGTLSVLMNIYWGAGFLLSVLSSWILLPRVTWGWRIVAAAAAIPGLVTLPFRIFADESPRYLLASQQYKAVADILIKISKQNKKPAPILFGELKTVNVQSAKQNILGKLALLFSRQLYLSTILLCIIWFMLTFASYGFSFLLPIVFAKKKAGDNIYIDALVVSAANAIGYILTSVLMEKVSRKKLLGVSFVLSAGFTALLAISDDTTYIFVMAIFVSAVSAVPWATLYTYTPEVYPTVVRATGTGITSAFTRTGGAVTPLVGEVLLAKSYAAPFLIFAISMLIAGLLCFLLPIETFGKDLSDDVSADETKKRNIRSSADSPFLIENQPNDGQEFEDRE